MSNLKQLHNTYYRSHDQTRHAHLHDTVEVDVPGLAAVANQVAVVFAGIGCEMVNDFRGTIIRTQKQKPLMLKKYRAITSHFQAFHNLATKVIHRYNLMLTLILSLTHVGNDNFFGHWRIIHRKWPKSTTPLPAHSRPAAVLQKFKSSTH